jgi:hypothetical protein
MHPDYFQENWVKAGELAEKFKLDRQYVFEMLSDRGSSLKLGAKMSEKELMAKAVKIRNATGVPMGSVIKALRENPEEASAGSAGPTTTRPEPAIDFMKFVEDIQLKYGLSYRDAYLKARKQNEPAFQRWLESVQEG